MKTYTDDEPILHQKLDTMAEVFSWWQRTTHEEHVAIMRAFIDYERAEASLADARMAHPQMTDSR
jgi:hypothetical protein